MRCVSRIHGDVTKVASQTYVPIVIFTNVSHIQTNKWRQNNRKHDMQEGDRGESEQ